MKEPTKNESISAAIEALNKEFESKQKDGESDDALGAALLDFILEKPLKLIYGGSSVLCEFIDIDGTPTLSQACLECIVSQRVE